MSAPRDIFEIIKECLELVCVLTHTRKTRSTGCSGGGSSSDSNGFSLSLSLLNSINVQQSFSPFLFVILRHRICILPRGKVIIVCFASS